MCRAKGGGGSVGGPPAAEVLEHEAHQVGQQARPQQLVPEGRTAATGESGTRQACGRRGSLVTPMIMLMQPLLLLITLLLMSW